MHRPGERMITSWPIQVNRTPVPLPQEVVDHYLEILGLARKDPSLEALRELLAAHLIKIPFVADVIVFLASDQARWVTGQRIYVGGGHGM